MSLIKFNKLPDVGVDFGDKIFHFLTYGLLTILWLYTFLYNFKFNFRHAIFTAAILSIVFGIIIEVLQGSLTSYRAFDGFDALANTLGVLIASLALWGKRNLGVKNL
ncbi:VanZ family protein [Seonamhaeicola maritimus]|uniref:VanZ family protein n=1 Tax=Seonamhaeicola maritimus TaxID=2591822 RepID=UPI0024951863|nr:VanZ family protein [Seonamhaeicola maritimus]